MLQLAAEPGLEDAVRRSEPFERALALALGRRAR